MSVDPKEFRHTLGRFMSGVTIVTVEDAGEVNGMTASAFISVSLDPPLILVSVDKRARMHTALPRAGRFGVSILGAEHEAISTHFAGRPQEGLLLSWLREGWGTPVLEGALANIDCDVWSSVEAGDHTLFVGLVKQVRYRDGDPLGYFHGKYRFLKPL